MAFYKDEVGIMQTATKAAADRVASEVTAGLIKTAAKADERFTALRAEAFAVLDEKRVADNVVFAENEANAPKRSSGGGARRSSGGGSKGGSDTFTEEQARAIVLKNGMFKGLTLGEVYDMPASEATDYTGREDEPGKDYVKWLATSGKNEFLARASKGILDAARAGSAE